MIKNFPFPLVFSYNFCTFALQNKQFNSLTNAIQKYCSNNNNKPDYRYNDEKIFDALCIFNDRSFFVCSRRQG